MKIKSSPKSFAIALFASNCASQASVLVTFGDNASYDNNFAELANGTHVSRDSGGYLVRTNTTASTATTAIYNTAASGGSSGSGGTTINTPYNTFGGTSGITLEIDYYQANPLATVGGASFGFYVKTAQNSNPTTGYVGVFRIADGSADFRVFDSNSNPGFAPVGTQIGTTQSYTGAFSASTYYTLKLDVIDIGGNVQFTGSIWNQGGAAIKTFTSITDTSSAVLGAGQVGFRLSNDNAAETRLDNFKIVPEPSSVALLGGLGTMLLLRRRRG